MRLISHVAPVDVVGDWDYEQDSSEDDADDESDD